MVYILGFGGIGGFLAARFSMHGIDVSVVSEKMKQDPFTLSFNGLHKQIGNITFIKKIYEKTGVIFLCCKSVSLNYAMVSIPDNFTGSVISLQNGIGFQDFLRERFINYIPGTIGKIIAAREGDVIHVESQSNPEISLFLEPGMSIKNFSFISQSGIDLVQKDSFEHLVWEKYSRLALFSLATTYYEQSIGEVFGDIHKISFLECIASELALISSSQGYKVSKDSLLNFMRGLPKSSISSLSRDILMRKESEYKYTIKPLLSISEIESIKTIYLEKVCKEIEEKWNIK
jgi:ketopantoate reductase